jgi:hypothetical protein
MDDWLADMIFFSYLTVSAIFFWKLFSKSCWTWSEQVKNDHFQRGCRWFQLFYFLTRIIPGLVTSSFSPWGLQHENCSPNSEQSSYERWWETKECLSVQLTFDENELTENYDKRMSRMTIRLTDCRIKGLKVCHTIGMFSYRLHPFLMYDTFFGSVSTTMVKITFYYV